MFWFEAKNMNFSTFWAGVVDDVVRWSSSKFVESARRVDLRADVHVIIDVVVDVGDVDDDNIVDDDDCMIDVNAETVVDEFDRIGEDDNELVVVVVVVVVDDGGDEDSEFW